MYIILFSYSACGGSWYTSFVEVKMPGSCDSEQDSSPSLISSLRKFRFQNKTKQSQLPETQSSNNSTPTYSSNNSTPSQSSNSSAKSSKNKSPSNSNIGMNVFYLIFV